MLQMIYRPFLPSQWESIKVVLTSFREIPKHIEGQFLTFLIDFLPYSFSLLDFIPFVPLQAVWDLVLRQSWMFVGPNE